MTRAPARLQQPTTCRGLESESGAGIGPAGKTAGRPALAGHSWSAPGLTASMDSARSSTLRPRFTDRETDLNAAPSSLRFALLLQLAT